MRLQLPTFAVCLLLLGCEDTNTVPLEGGPYIDATSEEAYTKSIAAARASLPTEEERKAFDRGLEKLLGNVSVHKMLTATQAVLPGGTPAAPGGETKLPGPTAEKQPLEKKAARQFVHLMTAQDVLREGGQIKTTVYDLAIKRNEAAAIANLQTIANAQVELQNNVAIDVDKDGKGEFGVFAEMTGTAELRAHPSVTERDVLEKPLIPARFSRVKKRVVTLEGYHYQVFLPGQNGEAIQEDPFGGYSGDRVHTDLSEKCWCAIAWPVVPGETGRRVFFINQQWTVLAHPNEDGELGKDGVPVSPLLAFKKDKRRLDGKLDYDPKAKEPKKGQWTDKLFPKKKGKNKQK